MVGGEGVVPTHIDIHRNYEGRTLHLSPLGLLGRVGAAAHFGGMLMLTTGAPAPVSDCSRCFSPYAPLTGALYTYGRHFSCVVSLRRLICAYSARTASPVQAHCPRDAERP